MNLEQCQALHLHCLFNPHYSLVRFFVVLTHLLSLYSIDIGKDAESLRRNLPKVTQPVGGLDWNLDAQLQSTGFGLLCSPTFQQSRTIQAGRGGEAEQSHFLLQDHRGRPWSQPAS